MVILIREGLAGENSSVSPAGQAAICAGTDQPTLQSPAVGAAPPPQHVPWARASAAAKSRTRGGGEKRDSKSDIHGSLGNGEILVSKRMGGVSSASKLGAKSRGRSVIAAG